MRTLPIKNQPNFNGKIVFEKGTTETLTKSVSDSLWRKYDEINSLLAEKPYDVFISQNKQNSQFYDIAANKSFEEAQKIKEYTVKVQVDVIKDSIVAAAKDAMDMYEKFIAKNIKR